MGPKYSFRAKLWVYSGESAWYFVTLPQEYAREIKKLTENIAAKGFGSIKVRARIGDNSWDTSIFPDTKSQSYLLPIKKEIRKKFGITEAEILNITLQISDI